MKKLVFTAVCSFFLMYVSAISAQVNLAWDPPVTNENGTVIATNEIAFYNLRTGTNSGVYGSPVNVGLATSNTVTGLLSNEVYYFIVTAVSIYGDESSFSDELIWPIPSVVVNPAGGAYPQQQITIVCSNELWSSTTPATNEKVRVFYSLNGVDPTTASTQYTGPIVVGLTTNLLVFKTAAYPMVDYTNQAPFRTTNAYVRTIRIPGKTKNIRVQ